MGIFGKHPPRPPVAGTVGLRQKRTLDIVEQLSRIGGGRGITWTPFGPGITQPGTAVKIGRTPAGGIPGRVGGVLGQAVVAEWQIAEYDPSTTTISALPSSFTAVNYSATPVGANKYCVCSLLWGVWVVISAEC
jgi:hypothetical protein